jgi:hypothetical protein
MRAREDERPDVESEAAALAALAGVFKSVFKLDEIATGLYRCAFRLGLSLWPKNLHAEAWFQACAEVSA